MQDVQKVVSKPGFKNKKQRTNKKNEKAPLSEAKVAALKQKNEAKLKNATEALKSYKPIEVPKQFQDGSILNLPPSDATNAQPDLSRKAQKKLRRKMKLQELEKETKKTEKTVEKKTEGSPKKFENKNIDHKSEQKKQNGSQPNKKFENKSFRKNDHQNSNSHSQNDYKQKFDKKGKPNTPKKFENKSYQKSDQQSSNAHEGSDSREGNKQKFDKKRKLSPAYYEAATLLSKLAQRRGSLNSLISDCKNQNMIKLIYRLAIKVLQNQTLIRKICAQFDLGTLNKHLTEILLCDFLLGKPMFLNFRKVPEIDFVCKNQEDIQKHYREFKDKFSKTYASQPVRYFRINQIISSIDQVLKSLKDEVQMTQKTFDKKKTSFEEFKKLALALKEDEFMVDYHFDDIFVVLDKTTGMLKNSALYKNNSISIQDKSSILAVEAMKLKPNMRILDACAAPGMKSIAIASRLKNDCELFSNDMDATRYKDMRRFFNNSGVKCAKLSHSDFSALKPEDYTDLDVLLLDPSCTGSGMNRRLDYVNENEDMTVKEENEKKRSLKLSGFQYKLFEKALTFKPKRLVYSTCSKFQSENEDVVTKVFLNYPDLEYDVVDALPGWPIRGTGNAEWAELCVRSDLDSTLTGGFFCAVLERKPDADPNVSAVLEASFNVSSSAQDENNNGEKVDDESIEKEDMDLDEEVNSEHGEEEDEEDEEDEDLETESVDIKQEVIKTEAPPKRPSSSNLKASPMVPKTPKNTPVKTPSKSPAQTPASNKKTTPKRKSPQQGFQEELDHEDSPKRAKFDEKEAQQPKTVEKKTPAKGRGAKTPAKKVKTETVEEDPTMQTPEKTFTKFSPKFTRSRAKTVPKKPEVTETPAKKPRGKAGTAATKSLTTQLDSVAETPTRTLRKRARN